ncbi:hypothetical protein Tco_0663441, partial [Tanacetum coccineum]
ISLALTNIQSIEISHLIPGSLSTLPTPEAPSQGPNFIKAIRAMPDDDRHNVLLNEELQILPVVIFLPRISIRSSMTVWQQVEENRVSPVIAQQYQLVASRSSDVQWDYNHKAPAPGRLLLRADRGGTYIPTDGPATVEMVNASKIIVMRRPCKFQETIIMTQEKPLTKDVSLTSQSCPR